MVFLFKWKVQKHCTIPNKIDINKQLYSITIHNMILHLKQLLWHETIWPHSEDQRYFHLFQTIAPKKILQNYFDFPFFFQYPHLVVIEWENEIMQINEITPKCNNFKNKKIQQRSLTIATLCRYGIMLPIIVKCSTIFSTKY